MGLLADTHRCVRALRLCSAQFARWRSLICAIIVLSADSYKTAMRHNYLLILLSILLAPLLLAAAPPPRSAPPPRAATPPDVASYTLRVTLDPAAKTVRGEGLIAYRNPSPDTLRELWIRLYLKAFSTPDSLWLRESGGAHRGFDSADSRGDITLSRLALRGGPDLLASSTLTDTLLRVPLPTPLAPGALVELEVAWESLLPRVFARTGYGGRDDSFFMVGQWYPKMAVYHAGRWDTEPWHANSEFFHDFGRYELEITAPAEYIVAGVGVPSAGPRTVGAARIWPFLAEGVTDFAFAASPDFVTHTAQSGPTEIVLYDLPREGGAAARYLDVAVGALAAYSAWFGAYPHPRLTLIDVPASAGGAGGMEYPTLITGGTLGAEPDAGFLELVVAHEIAHQWWPMQTATNEGREPWLDEGLTEYSGIRYQLESGRELGFGAISAPVYDLASYAAGPGVRSDLPAWEYDSEYAIAVYSKPAVGLLTLERVVGTERFRAAMAAYLAKWRFRHPTAADFRAAMEAELGELGWFFDDYIGGTGMIGYRAMPIVNGPDGSSVRVERSGAIPVPAEVLVRFASGRTQLLAHDGGAAPLELSFPAADPVRAVVVDPEHKLYAELDRRDNGAYAELRLLPQAGFAARLAFWTQLIIQSLGLFG